MKLESMEPIETSLKISGLEIIFRPFTLADDIRNNIKFGEHAIKKAFEGFDFSLISEVAWYQLTIETQQNIIKFVSASTLDPMTGKEEEIHCTPIDKFRHLFVGIQDQINLLTTLVKCKGLNIPDINDSNAEEIKKFADQLQTATV